jgi:triacylglycerol lipase
MDYDPILGARMVALARIAYRDPAPAEAELATQGFRDFRFFDGPSTQAFAVVADHGAYVSFRGTESGNPVDWARDAQFRPVAGEPFGRVHSGFRRALDEVWGDVSAVVAAGSGPLFVTGHSLGAALATLAAARIADTARQVTAVHTFGTPRTGLGDFRNTFNERLGSRTFTVINHIDLVTRAPLLIQGYRHVGRRMYFDADGVFHPDAGAWQVARDDLSYRLRHFGRIESIGLLPHAIGAYVLRVESLLP